MEHHTVYRFIVSHGNFWTAGILHDIWYHFRNSNTKGKLFWILWIITYITTWAPQIFYFLFFEKPVSTPLALARQSIRWIESHRTLIKAPFWVAIHLSSSQQGIRMHTKHFLAANHKLLWRNRLISDRGTRFVLPLRNGVRISPKLSPSLPLAPTLVMPGERRKWIRRSNDTSIWSATNGMGAVQLDGGASERVNQSHHRDSRIQTSRSSGNDILAIKGAFPRCL